MPAGDRDRNVARGLGPVARFPSLLPPQQYVTPAFPPPAAAAVRPQLMLTPATSEEKVNPPETATGTLEFSPEKSPSFPERLLPQHQALPALVIAQV